MWITQEYLDLKSMLEAFASMAELEDKRKKLMKSIGLTDEGLNAMRPAATSAAKSMFDGQESAQAEIVNKKLASQFEV